MRISRYPASCQRRACEQASASTQQPIGVINPAWSWVQVGWARGEASYALSGRHLGHGPDGLQALLESLRSRQPEALGLRFAERTPEDLRARVREELWKGLDSAIPIRVAGGAS